MAPGKIQAVILCGPGSGLYPLVEAATVSEDREVDKNLLLRRQVKALLPVGSKAAIDYVLELAEEAGLSHVLVLASENEGGQISHHLRNRKAGVNVRSVANAAAASTDVEAVQVQAIPSAGVTLQNVPEDIVHEGAAQVLLWARQAGLIQRDFVILPCDLVLAAKTPTTSAGAPWKSNNISLSLLLDRHVSSNALLTTLMYEREAGAVLPARKNGPPEVLAVTDANDALVDLVELDDIADEDEVTIARVIANAASDSGKSWTLTTNLLPAQIVVMSERVWPIIAAHERRVASIDSLVDLVGWICRSHERAKLRAANKAAKQQSSDYFRAQRGKLDAWVGSGDVVTAMDDLNLQDEEPVSGKSSPSSGAARGALLRALEPSLYDACLVFVWRKENGWAGRSNSVASLLAQNRASLLYGLFDTSDAPSPTWSPTAQISQDSWVHPSATLGDKVSIKRSFVGRNCTIGKNCRIQGSLIMDNVSIRDNVKLDNSVVSSHVSIQDRSALSSCELGAFVQLGPDTALKSEQLVVEEL